MVKDINHLYKSKGHQVTQTLHLSPWFAEDHHFFFFASLF
jgi:hypothetical protein